ncbi:MAG: sulfotransferase domain-containing protein [Anaerolineaceae bacterium]
MTLTLPTFFILGAAKAGTTTLADLLRQHPQVYLPFDKEPMFFSRDSLYQKGLEWYCRTFYRDSEAFSTRGEATPHYLYWADKVAPRIRSALAGNPLRFIIILRNPADRAYSWYWNMVREGLEDLSFEQALAAEPDRLNRHMDTLRSLGSMQYGYARGGQYAAQIACFLALFERQHFLFLLQEDVRQNFAAVRRKIFGFLEIDGQVEISAIIRNPASLPRSRAVQKALQGPSTIKEWVKHLVPRRLRYQLKRALLDANAVETQYPPMPTATRAMLHELFRESNRELARLIDRDLAQWETV